ncbi:MAG: hypothetical protein ACI8PZ_006746 [Myxococcota bacterium]|jgi:hypothetical protein
MRRLPLLAVALLIGCQEYNISGGEKPGRADGDTGDPVTDGTTPPTTPSTPTTPTYTDPPVEPAPEIEVDPSLLDFGLWPEDCPSPMIPVTISNIGTADLDVSRIELQNNGSGVFRISSTAPALVPPGGSHEFLVDFTPADLVGYPSANVHIWSNDADEAELDVLLDGEGSDVAEWTDRWEQNETGPVDVLFVLDNSGSMDGEIDNLANTFDVFINGFVALGLDYQIGVVTTDMDNPAQSGQLLGPDRIITPALPDPVASFRAATDQGAGGSGSERGLEAAHVALTEPLISGHNSGLVRADSTLSVIVVTDENDDSNDYIRPVDFADFLDAYQGDPGRTSFSAVAGRKSGILPCISLFSGVSAEPAPRYWTVVSQTDGIHSLICDMDMSRILTDLSVVASGMLTRFPLTLVPADPAGVDVTIEGFVVPHSESNGVSYDATTNSLVFTGDWVPQPGNDVVATYEVEEACP